MKNNYLLKHYKNLYYTTIKNKIHIYNKNIDKSKWLSKTLYIRRSYRNHKWHAIDFAKRMASLHDVDDLIKSIWEKLKQNNQLNNTIWIFTSDNGYNYGSHNLIHKMSPYEESIHIPLYIYHPNNTNINITIDKYVSLIDIAPTILSFAGIAIPEYIDGIDLFSSEFQNIDRPLLFQYGGYMMTEMLSGILMDVYLELHPTLLAFIPHVFFMDVPTFRAIRYNDYMFIEYHTVYGKPINNNKITNFYLYNTLSPPFFPYFSKLYREYEFYNIKQDHIEGVNLINTFNTTEFIYWKQLLDYYNECTGRGCLITES